MLGKDWRTGEHQKWLATHESDQDARKHVEGVARGFAIDRRGHVRRIAPVTVGAGTAANDNGKVVVVADRFHVGDTMPLDWFPPTIDTLPRHGFTYLASPYSLYKHGFHMAARHASRAAACLMNKGLVVYAPISMGHAIACDNDLPATWEFWKGQCQPFIDAASACVVLKLDGWEESVGVSYEVEEFGRQGKPVVYVGMDDLLLREETIEDEWKRRVG